MISSPLAFWVVGTGPTGRTMANILSRVGASVTILDRKAGPVEQCRALTAGAALGAARGRQGRGHDPRGGPKTFA